MKLATETLYYFNKGELIDAYNYFGAHLITKDRARHTLFRVYAPHAKSVHIIGEWNGYTEGDHVMEKTDQAGIFALLIEEDLEWKAYKYVIHTEDGRTLTKSDPYAFYSGFRPDTTSKVYDINGYDWQDGAYMEKRVEEAPYNHPVSIYEMHLGTWMQKPNGSFNTYSELAALLIPYLKENNYTHVEFMPIYEHPFDGSWGYQGTGYYSVTSRYGVPKDFMYLVDQLHQHDIKVILDWVPGHICKDAHGLYMFDGEPLYEYQDAEIRENIEWGTANLDLGRAETQSFLISNALFYMKYFHIDGFRIDAVSNIIYYLGDARRGENHGALEFLRKLSRAVFSEFSHALLAAEDSTAFPKVTHPIEYGGLGFNYKWNMGWMNDTLKYFSRDSVYRKFHHHELTFSLTYAFSENYILPFSHDEVVHGKKSLVGKMPGDYWQKFANYRALMGYFYTHPGKKLLFMGQEFAQMHEWKDYEELDWHLRVYPMHESALRYNRDFNALITQEKALYEADHLPETFTWIDANNAEQSIYSFVRFSKGKKEHIVVVLNLTPNAYHDFSIGVPSQGKYSEIMNSDYEGYGGSNQYNGSALYTNQEARHGFAQSISITVAPLSVTLLKWRGDNEA